MSNSADLEEILDITFSDKSLLQRALTHRSYLNEYPDSPLSDNERLEFLGDAILDFITAETLYNRFPEMKEGDLTNLRAALVREETLADFAAALNLGQYLYMGRGEAESGGRKRPVILCAAFEALVGAIFLDQGLEVTKQFLNKFTEPKLRRLAQDQMEKDSKSLLQELSQRQWRLTPVYRTIAERGPDHAKEFTVEVLIGDEVYGQGVGHSKQAAEQEAARKALAKVSE